MDKVDFKKADAYRAISRVTFLIPGPAQYLMVDGQGDPNTSEDYERALQTLYPIAYKLKFASKLAGRDYVVPPLEGLWWAGDMSVFTSARDKSRWQWTLMLMLPAWLDADDAARAMELARKTRDLPGLDELRFERLDEGPCAQVLHVGPYDAEAETIERLHRTIDEHGCSLTGRHHEIYLSDPRRVAPAKLRTILRQPVAPPPSTIPTD